VPIYALTGAMILISGLLFVGLYLQQRHSQRKNGPG
jgi:hypothetical protein